MSGPIWATTILVFFGGLSMVILRRQLLAMLLGLELMISAVNIALVYHAGLFGDAQGFAAALLILAVAAAEAVVGLSLILQLHRAGKPVDAAALTELRDDRSLARVWPVLAPLTALALAFHLPSL